MQKYQLTMLYLKLSIVNYTSIKNNNLLLVSSSWCETMDTKSCSATLVYLGSFDLKRHMWFWQIIPEVGVKFLKCKA